MGEIIYKLLEFERNIY